MQQSSLEADFWLSCAESGCCLLSIQLTGQQPDKSLPASAYYPCHVLGPTRFAFVYLCRCCCCCFCCCWCANNLLECCNSSQVNAQTQQQPQITQTRSYTHTCTECIAPPQSTVCRSDRHLLKRSYSNEYAALG